MSVTYYIERRTYGIDRYEVAFDDDEPHDEHWAIEEAERGYESCHHEDLEWGPFEVVEVEEY